MAKRPEKPKAQVRPGFRRSVQWSVRTGKLFALLILAVAGWLLYDSLSAPRFAVRAVQTRGTLALSPKDVTTLADVSGASIWYVQADQIEERVRQSPYVERVRAEVVLPDQVIVEVQERKPDVRWTHAGTSYAVTWDGLVLDQEAPLASAAVLSQTSTLSQTQTISGTQTTSGDQSTFVSSIAIVDTTPNPEYKIKPGVKVDADALEVARRVSLRAAELPAPLQRIEWDAGLGVSLIVGDSKQAVIGKSDRLDEKLAILAQVLRDGTQFKYLDLRSNAPYYR